MKQKAKQKRLDNRVTAYENTLRSRNVNTAAWHKPGSYK